MESRAFFYRDTWVEVDLDSIKNNIGNIRGQLPNGVEIFAVVKANAYGHGDVQVAKTAIEAGATYLAVAFMDEALALRMKGIQVPILVLGASRPEDVNIAAENNITLTIYQEQWIQKASEFLSEELKVSVHLKLDTGMGRIGVRSESELRSIERLMNKDKRIELEGVFTHFATADELDNGYFEQQLDRFREMISWLEKKPKYIHASNSAAAIRFPAARFNGVRLGIAMYGLPPSLEMESEIPVPLHEAFSLHSRVVHVKNIQKGEKVSYGATYEAASEEWIGTIPIGYADGWIRKLQGQEVLIDGIRVPIVGRICMDQCMIKLPYEVPIGTVVTLIGAQGDEKISINEIADHLETINYEVPCIISSRVPRVYKKSGEIIDMKNSLLLPESF